MKLSILFAVIGILVPSIAISQDTKKSDIISNNDSEISYYIDEQTGAWYIVSKNGSMIPRYCNIYISGIGRIVGQLFKVDIITNDKNTDEQIVKNICIRISR